MVVNDFTLIKQKNLLKTVSLVSILTLLSRSSGLVRDIVIASLFGATAEIDAFLVAFRLPNFMRRLFAEGAFSQALVPTLSQYKQGGSRAQVLNFLSHVAGNVGIILIFIILFGLVAAPAMVKVFAPGFASNATQLQLTSNLLRITLPYVLFISLTAIAGAALNAYQHFATSAFTPIILNMVMIISAVFFANYFIPPITVLGWSILAAGILQLLFQIPFLSRARLFFWPRINWQDPAVRRLLLSILPAIFGVSTIQINMLVNTAFASFLPVGSVTWLYFTDRLVEFPLGVIGVAISTVILPHLSQQHVMQSNDNFSHALDWGLRVILLIAFPAMLGLTILAGPLLATLLFYGKFNAQDVLQTSYSLITLSLGIPAFMLIKTVVSGFYATQDIKTPVKIGLISIVCNILLCLLLRKSLAHAGLTLASALAAVINVGGLLLILIKRKIYRPHHGWLKYLWQLAIANCAMASFLILRVATTQQWLTWSSYQRVGELLLEISVAIIIYLTFLKISGLNFQRLIAYERGIYED